MILQGPRLTSRPDSLTIPALRSVDNRRTPHTLTSRPRSHAHFTTAGRTRRIISHHKGDRLVAEANTLPTPRSGLRTASPHVTPNTCPAPGDPVPAESLGRPGPSPSAARNLATHHNNDLH